MASQIKKLLFLRGSQFWCERPYKMISPQNFAKFMPLFWPQTKLYKGSNVFLDDSLRGQVKMDTKKRCIRECCKCTQFVRTFWRLFPQFRSFWMSLKSNRKKNIFNPFKKNSKNHVSRYLLYFNICYSASFVHDDNKFFVLNDQIFLKLFNI